MPGEPLTSIWQTAFALSPESSVIEKNNLHRIFSLIGLSVKCVTFSETYFNNIIFDGVSFNDCKDYIVLHLVDFGTPQKLVEEKIENACWEICRYVYDQTLQESTLFQLWTITNRLIEENSYPPVMSKKNALWISEKIVASLEKPMFVKNIGFPEEGVTFQDFVRLLNKQIFYRVETESLSQAIQSLHEWLVNEVINSGWLSLRMRNQANWSTWKKHWCVLTPGKLQYGNKTDDKNPPSRKPECNIYLTESSKIESTDGYKGIIHRYKYTFKVLIPPVFQCEFAVESEPEKHSWITCIREVIQTTKEGTTPLRKVLRKDKSNVESKGDNNSKLERSFQKSTMRRKKSAKEEKEPSPPKEEEKKNVNFIRKERGPSLPEVQVNKPDKFLKEEKDKIKAVFMKIDQDGNGILDKDEFVRAVKDFGLAMEDKEINFVFHTVDKSSDNCITFDEFCDYFITSIIGEKKTDVSTSAMRRAFLTADRDGTGTLNFQEFAEVIWERRRSVRVSSLFKVFDEMKEEESNEIRFDGFKETLLTDDMGITFEDETKELDHICGLENHLKQSFDDSESQDLTNYIKKRWNKFVSFRRAGASGSCVMKGGHGIVDDIVPGDYNLIDLALFSDLPPLIPKHTVVKGVKWVMSSIPNISGKLFFPADFDGNVVTEFATSERLRYYGCSFADDRQEKISLLYRHGIQDFTYENKYLSDYVTKTNGGSGVERHDFSHLDCPLDEDSGHFILAKLVGDELHITAFKVPVRHTIYIPGGCIHSNDYLKGTWRTMLSDETAINHVHLIRQRSDDDGSPFDEHFLFKFC